MSWLTFPSLLVILSDLNPLSSHPLCLFIYIFFKLKQPKPASVIMEHQGLISRPGLQGTEQDTLLTSTGLSAVPRRKKRAAMKTVKEPCNTAVRGQPVHVNTKPPCDFIHIPQHRRAIFLQIHPEAHLGEKVIASICVILHCCRLLLAPWDRSILVPTESILIVTFSDSFLTCA